MRVMETKSDHRFVVFEKYRPHALWAVISVILPFGLLMVSLVGLEVGSTVPISVAAAAPPLALALAATGMALGVARRRPPLIAIGGIGLSISGIGFLLLWWLGR